MSVVIREGIMHENASAKRNDADDARKAKISGVLCSRLCASEGRLEPRRRRLLCRVISRLEMSRQEVRGPSDGQHDGGSKCIKYSITYIF